MKKVAIFVSGRGSLVESFHEHSEIKVEEIIADRECGGRDVAENLNIPFKIVNQYDKKLANELNLNGVQTVVLAGFLKILKNEFLENFDGTVVNSHPALLPKFGGKGFYGDKVHQAVLEAGEQETGFTVHLVTEGVDEGPIVRQEAVPVLSDDTVESLRDRVQKLERELYASIVAEM